MSCRRPVVGLALLAVALGACTPPPEAVGPVERQVVAEAADPLTLVPVSGVITNRLPVPSVPPLPWLPLAAVAAEGSATEAGDDLLAFDPEDLSRRLENARQRLAGEQASDVRRGLEDARRQSSETAQVRELQARIRVLASKLEGRRRDEPGARKIAALQTEVALRTRDRAQRRATMVAALVAAGRLTDHDQILARADLAQAEAGLAAARRTEASWDEGTEALARAGLDLDLTDAQDRLDGEQRSLIARQQLGRRQSDGWRAFGDLTRRGRIAEVEELTTITTTPRLTAPVAGRVVYRDPSLRPGAKRPRTPLLFVLEDREDVAELLIPADLRDVVSVADPADPTRGRVRLRSTALPGQEIGGRVIAIAAAPITRPGRPTGFPATIRLDDGPRPPVGATVEADLLVPTPGAVRLPRWAVHTGADAREPVAILADGSHRRLRVLVQDQAVIVTAGLAPGDTVLALGEPPVGDQATRLTGTLEVDGEVVVRLRSEDWDVVEVVPDGALVEEGATLARLAKNSWSTDYEAKRREQSTALERARLTRELDEIEALVLLFDARNRLAEAQFALRRAVLDRRRAELDGLADRLAAAEADLARKTATAAKAGSAAEAAADPRVRVGLSTSAAEDLRLKAGKATASVIQARLNTASARIPDQFKAASAALAEAQAQQGVASAARNLNLVRLEAAARRDRATTNFRREEENIARDGERLIDEVVLAPVAGRVVYRPGAPLTAGAPIPGIDLLGILPEPAPGAMVSRRLALQVPAHRAGAWKVGDQVPVTVPGGGTWPARVMTVGSWYGSREDAGAGDEQVTDLVLSLAVPAAEADRVLPGMQGWIP